MSGEDHASTPAGGEGDGGLEATRRERRELEERMGEIRERVRADVEANWPAMWRSPELVEAKVNARLSGHKGYQELLERVRATESREADLEAERPGGATDRTDD